MRAGKIQKYGWHADFGGAYWSVLNRPEVLLVNTTSA